MWNLMQLVENVETKEKVIYLGILHEKEEESDPEPGAYFLHSDMRITNDEITEYTHIEKEGRILFGENVKKFKIGGEYFGIVHPGLGIKKVIELFKSPGNFSWG